MCGEEAPVTSTLDDLFSWLRQPEIDEFLDRRDAVRNVKRPAFPEKFLDIFLSVTRGPSVIRQGYGVWKFDSIICLYIKVGLIDSQPSRAYARTPGVKDVTLAECGPPCGIVKQTGLCPSTDSFGRMTIVSTGYLFGIGITYTSRRSMAS